MAFYNVTYTIAHLKLKVNAMVKPILDHVAMVWSPHTQETLIP